MSNADEVPELSALERVLDDPDELLHRQIHPNFYDQETKVLTRQVFKPRDPKISVTQDCIFNVEEAYRQHLQNGRSSIGACTVSVGEVRECDVSVVDDSEIPDTPDGHAYIDARSLTNRQRSDVAQSLLEAAQRRGLFVPTET